MNRELMAADAGRHGECAATSKALMYASCLAPVQSDRLPRRGVRCHIRQLVYWSIVEQPLSSRRGPDDKLTLEASAL
jgi:hypothetical protein